MTNRRPGSLRTRFTKTYGVSYPIASAGMAFVTLSPGLPVAVARAGAMGAFGAGILPVDVIRDNLKAIREQVRSPLHLNLITQFASDEHIEMCIDEKLDVVSFHWCHPPRQWISRLREAGISVWEQIGTVDGAKRALDDEVDLIIAQGLEAGGHSLGQLPVFTLLPAVVETAGDALVLAAGGIVDGRGLVAALALGADGICMGTRLVATDEADVAREYKEKIVAAGAGDTVLTSIFGPDMPDFNPMRVICNRLVQESLSGNTGASESGSEPAIGHTSIGGHDVPITRFSSLLPVRGASGDFEQMALPAGQGVGGIRDIVPASSAIERVVNEALAVISALTEAH